jgi:hypothetical protein
MRTCSLRLIQFRCPLAHEIEEGELTSIDAVRVYEATGQVAAEDGAQVVVRNLAMLVKGTSIGDIRYLPSL